MNENTIRRHTLLIQGVNNYLSAEEACKGMRKMFENLAYSSGVEKNNFEEPLVV